MAKEQGIGDDSSPEARAERGFRRVRLTDAGIRALPSGDGRPIDYSDTVQRGLRLRVSATGERSFLVAYRRPKDGQRIKLSIGSLSEGITLARARAEVVSLLALLRREPPVDPAEERARRRETARADVEAVRFADVCNAYMAEELPAMRPVTRKGWRRYIEVEIVPALGHYKPEDIRAESVEELRAQIARGIPGQKNKDGLTWKRRPAPTSAQRMLVVLRRIFAWLSTSDQEVDHARKRHGLRRLEVNPATSVGSYRRKRRAGKKTRAESAMKAYSDQQLQRLFRAAGDVVVRANATRETMKRRVLTGPSAHEIEARAYENLMLLIAHTGVRSHDARSGRWENVDEARKLWTIPEHKTSDDTGAPHVVPLTDSALRVLACIREASLAAGYGRSAWLFPADTQACEVCERPGHVNKDPTATKRIKTAAGVGGRGLLHRLRDTLRTRLSEHGTDARVAEAIIAHAPAGIVGTYDHAELLPQRRVALEWWSEELARILGEGLESSSSAMAPS